MADCGNVGSNDPGVNVNEGSKTAWESKMDDTSNSMHDHGSVSEGDDYNGGEETVLGERRSILRISEDGTKHYTPICESSIKPYNGREFARVEDGFSCYANYARTCGFESKRFTSRKGKQGLIKTRYVVCNRQGLKQGDANSGVRQTVSKRCNCGAKAILTLTTEGMWSVTMFEEEHNHSLGSKLGDIFLKRRLPFTEEQEKHVIDCSLARIGTVKSFKLWEISHGGPAHASGNVTQFKNCKRNLTLGVDGADSAMVVKKLEIKQGECAAYYFKYEVDNKRRLTHLFWADPIARKNCELFGEVVAFDATYKTNRYNMVFAPFTGLNNHNKCVTYGAALILKEDVESYEWVFMAYKEAMGKDPKIIVTDQDPAMKVAISRVFATSQHRFCMWHIMSKLPEKVGHALSQCSDFTKRIHGVVWNEEITPAEFEEEWQCIIVEYNLSSHKWLSYIYSIRYSWIPAYFRDVQYGGVIKTTSISESQNSYFKCYSHYSLKLVELLTHFDSALENQRHKCNKMTVDQETKLPDLETNLALEKYCATVFTLHAFNVIKGELQCACRVVCITEDGNVSNFTIRDGEKRRRKEYRVDYEANTGNAVCSCGLFTRMGLPCRHIFVALRGLEVSMLHVSLVCKRWTKAVSIGMTFTYDGVAVCQYPRWEGVGVDGNAIRATVFKCMRLIADALRRRRNSKVC